MILGGKWWVTWWTPCQSTPVLLGGGVSMSGPTFYVNRLVEIHMESTLVSGLDPPKVAWVFSLCFQKRLPSPPRF